MELSLCNHDKTFPTVLQLGTVLSLLKAQTKFPWHKLLQIHYKSIDAKIVVKIFTTTKYFKVVVKRIVEGGSGGVELILRYIDI